jgi:hypothetical protein
LETNAMTRSIRLVEEPDPVESAPFDEAVAVDAMRPVLGAGYVPKSGNTEGELGKKKQRKTLITVI